MTNRISMAAVLILVASASHAQTDSAASHPCWRGSPAPDCTSFFITEFGLQRAVATIQGRSTNAAQPTSSEREDRKRIAWTVGPMYNIAATRAVGATVTVGPLFPGSYTALEGRHRWWFGEVSALDVSGGILRIASGYVNSSRLRTGYGLTGGVFLVSNDIINLSAHGDVLLADGRPQFSLSIGAGLGSYMTAAVTPVALLLVLVANAYAHEGT